MQSKVISYKALAPLVLVLCVLVIFVSQMNIERYEVSPVFRQNTQLTNRSAVRIRNNDEPFKIIILTQRRHWSLKRLLESLQAASYMNHSVAMEIRIDFHTSEDHAKTKQLANNFNFTHGPKRVIVYSKKQGLLNAWFNAWTPASDKERAIILEDDMQLSPFWHIWIQRAWSEYGDLKELGGISLCRQRLNGTNGASVFVESNTPFLYRIFGTFGYSPNARYWRRFVKWVRKADLSNTNIRVPGVITTSWWENGDVVWEQYWIWWYSMNSGRQLYTLYVHSRKGALVTHWQEPGEHSQLKKGAPSDPLLNKMEPVLQTFPNRLDHYGWNFRVEPYK